MGDATILAARPPANFEVLSLLATGVLMPLFLDGLKHVWPYVTRRENEFTALLCVAIYLLAWAIFSGAGVEVWDYIEKGMGAAGVGMLVHQRTNPNKPSGKKRGVMSTAEEWVRTGRKTLTGDDEWGRR